MGKREKFIFIYHTRRYAVALVVEKKFMHKITILMHERASFKSIRFLSLYESWTYCWQQQKMSTLDKQSTSFQEDQPAQGL